MNKAKDSKQVIVELNTCPKCGKQFKCSTSAKCWCYEYDVPVEVMEDLQQEFEGCLCPDCLKTYAR
jgi:hypothetical protein